MGSTAAGKKPIVASPLKGTPVYFCTSAQAATLISEGRQLFLFVRHGSTDWNNEMRLQGREDIPLNRDGREQAARCAEGISAALSGSSQPVKVYTSPLSRAVDTAQYITKALGITGAEITNALIERDYSSLAGLTPPERRQRYPSCESYPDDMESCADATLRMKRAIALLREKNPDGVSIAVTHGGVMNALFSYISGGRAGNGRNITANCRACVLCAGKNDVIPLAFNLDGEALREYLKNINI